MAIENGSSRADPTALTTRQLLREIESLEKLVTQRIDGIEKAVDVAHQDLVRVPTDVDKAIGNLDSLITYKLKAIKKTFETIYEKFASVEKQFRERDTRTEQNQRDTKVAVDAALSAAKEAVSKQQEASERASSKMEASISGQISAQGVLIAATKTATDQQITDLKERLTKIESIGLGMDRAVLARGTADTRSTSIMGIVIGSIIAVLGVVAGLVVHFAK